MLGASVRAWLYPTSLPCLLTLNFSNLLRKTLANRMLNDVYCDMISKITCRLSYVRLVPCMRVLNPISMSVAPTDPMAIWASRHEEVLSSSSSRANMLSRYLHPPVGHINASPYVQTLRHLFPANIPTNFSIFRREPVRTRSSFSSARD